MELDNSNNHLPFSNPTILSKSSPSTSDTDTEAPPPPPPLQTHLQKSLSLSNGGGASSSSPFPRRHHQMLSLPPSSYKECLRNHAAGMGGLALDGCGEFMPSSPNSSASGGDPTSLKCAACGCHRNFHRREPSSGHLHQQSLPFPALQWTHHRNSLSPSVSPGQTSSGGGAPSPSPSPSSPAAAASPTPQHSIFPSSAPHMLLALSSGAAAAAAAESNPHHHRQHQGRNPANPNEIGRKRARTRFTTDQKARMHDFAERLGWKMLRGNEDRIVEDFCAGIGVRRNVFKVWMHNNKHRKDKAAGNGNTNGNGDDGGRFANGGNGGGEDDDEDEDEDDKVKNVKYDLNNSSIGGNSTRVRFDTDVFESKVHVLGHHGGSSP